jgi:hypothetical protein
MDAFDQTYDVAVSYAEEELPYVEEFVLACRARGLQVFFDRDHRVAVWGYFYVIKLHKIYGGTTVRHVVPFISADYLRRPFPMRELKAALSQALLRDVEDYVLPVIVGEVDLPNGLIGPHVGQLRTEDFSPDELAKALAKKLGARQP